MTTAAQPAPGVPPADRAAPPRRRVLMLSHRLPYPPDRGDRIRSYHILKLLARHFDLAVACTSDEPVWLQHHQLLMTMAHRVAIQPILPYYSRLRGLGALCTGQAVTPACYYRLGLADTILQWHEQQPFHAVLTYCTGMVRYSRLLAGKTPPATAADPHPAPVRHVMDLVDVDSLKWESYARSTWPPMKWVYAAEARRLRQIEAGRLDHFDAVTVVSQNEAAAYRQSVGDHPGLMAIPNGVDLEYFAPLPDAPSNAIVFVGVLNYRPNCEGITWFVRHVMPPLRQRVPDIHLQVVGRHPTPAMMELGRQPGVEVVGSVPDVREYLRDAAAVIAPLRLARGIQNKVLEAMAAERAIVCSPGAAQGLDATPGLHLLVADTPEQWVMHLEKLLNDGAARRVMAAAARAYVQEHHSWEKCLQPMLGLLAPEGAASGV